MAEETVVATPTTEAPAEDNGLGLSGWLKSIEAEGKEPSQPVEEVKTEETPEVKPEVEQVKPEGETPAEPPVEQVEKPSDNWEKRYWDTQRYATQVNQQNANFQRMLAEQQRQLEIVNKKLDGTYDPVKDEAPQVTPDEIAERAESAGRIAASRSGAMQIYGADNVEKMLWTPDAPFREIENNPLIRARVLNAESPVMEAINCTKEHLFYKKWGYTPEAIEKNMRAELEKEIREKVTKEFQSKISGKDSIPTGIGDARSVASGGTPQPSGEFTSLDKIFQR
jgi:hypothetical protein